MKLFNYVVECNLGSRQPITHMRLHKHPRFGRPDYRHFVWWKLSLLFGQPHLVPVTVCKACGEEVQGMDIGKYGPLSYCEGCQQVEPETEETTTEEYEARV